MCKNNLNVCAYAMSKPKQSAEASHHNLTRQPLVARSAGPGLGFGL
jgi:hypothetical protein